MIRIVPLAIEHLDDITEIHISSLNNDFLPSLGFNFLKSLYKGIIYKKNIYGFVAVDNNEVLGFVIGTKNMRDYLVLSLRSNFWESFFYLSLRLIQKPQLLKNVIETLTYSSKEKGPSAELVVIAILKMYRGKGLGRKLVKKLEKKFEEDNIKKYKLTVHADKEAVYFYENLGYDRISQFRLYNKLWYIYGKKIK